MDLRKDLGGKLEDMMNKAVDKFLDAEAIKQELQDAIDKLIDEKLKSLKHYLKAEVIDKLDGEDDIK